MAVLTVAASTACKTNGTGGSSTGGKGGDAPNCGLTEAKNTEFCQANPGSLDCTDLVGQKNSVCGVALPTPPNDPKTMKPTELTRATDTKEFAGMGPPQTDCYAPANYPKAPGTSQMVKAKGLAKIFSSGCNSHDLHITFYKVKRGGADDGALGDVVGTTVVTDADCTTTGTKTDNAKCTDGRYECSYEYPNVPTETELAIKTEGTGVWAPLIQYNVYIPNAEVMNGEWTHDVRALDAGDYQTIPAVAIGGPVTSGNGVIAGEVHDCGDVRVIDAIADIDKSRAGHTYFGSDEDNPLPDLQAKGTSRNGLYAAFDITPGPVTVAALGVVNGEIRTLGEHRVYIYPDSVTSVTFKGMQPYQLPATK